MNFEQNENKEGNQNGEQSGVVAGHIEQVASALPGQKWYKCAYCKGGFSRAQALGGHMNAHRRERALRSRYSPATYDREDRSSSPPSSLSSPSPSDQASWSSLIPQLRARPSRGKFISEKACERFHLNSYNEYSHEKLQIKFNSEEMGSSRDNEEVDLELRLGQNPHNQSRRNLPYFTIL